MSASSPLPDISETLARTLRRAGRRVAFAESCTGGLVGAALARRAGASDYFMGSAVCYETAAKTSVLGVSASLLKRHGPVSSACARAMAKGALKIYRADIAVSVTGFAGPGGERVGEVWVGWAVRGGESGAQVFHFTGGRDAVRTRAVRAVLRRLSILLPKARAAC